MKAIKGSVLAGIIVIALIISVAGCKSYDEEKNKLTDTPERGTIHISVDESFKPVIDAQVEVYEANNPGTHIIVHYKPEADCFKDFEVDSIRMVIATRGFDEYEESVMIDSLKVGPRSMVVAKDAIAVIVNPESPDSIFTMKELRDVLAGRFNRNLIPVFDGVKATSTVRFIVDSILKNDSLSPKAVAALTSEGVIDYIAKTRGAIGLIGVSWVGNKEDTMQTNFLTKVKLARLESTDKSGVYVLPYQTNIHMKRYPMVRDLVYTLKERHRGLGTGFADFLGGEIGQLIFKRAYLAPEKRNFILRKVRLVQ